MPRNGSGQYDLPYNWNDDRTNGVMVLASRMQTQDQDIATALSGSLAKDGQTPLTGNLDFNNNKPINLAAGSASDDATIVSQSQTGEFQYYGVSATTPAGTDGLNYDISPTPVFLAYPTYTRFSFTCHFTCIANPVARFDSLATKTLVKSDGASGYTALIAGDMIADKEYVCSYNEDNSTTRIVVENPETANFTITDLTISKKLDFTANSATIATGTITYTGAYMVVDTEGSAATDDLTTISGGGSGDLVIISQANSARDITIKNGTGNIKTSTGTDLVFTDTEDRAAFMYDGANWVEVFRAIQKDFLSSKSTDSYTFLPNGVIMQFGSMTPGGGFITETFPIAFPTACIFVWPEQIASSYRSFNVDILSTTQFRAEAISTVSTEVRYFAIGY